MNHSSAAYFGFETKALEENHLRPEWIGMELDAYVESLIDLDFTHFVILKRKNYLRRLVSALVGRQRGTFISQSEVHTPVPVNVDLKNVADRKDPRFQYTLSQYFSKIDSHYHELADLLREQEPLFLTYEDHVQEDPLVAYRKVCHYIGAEPEPVDIKIRKTTPFALDEIVLNYDEVRTTIEGTEFEWMLYE